MPEKPTLSKMPQMSRTKNSESLTLTKMRVQNGSVTDCNGNMRALERKGKADPTDQSNCSNGPPPLQAEARQVQYLCLHTAVWPVSSTTLPSSNVNLSMPSYRVTFPTSPPHKTTFGFTEGSHWQFLSVMWFWNQGIWRLTSRTWMVSLQDKRGWDSRVSEGIVVAHGFSVWATPPRAPQTDAGTGLRQLLYKSYH